MNLRIPGRSFYSSKNLTSFSKQKSPETYLLNAHTRTHKADIMWIPDEAHLYSIILFRKCSRTSYCRQQTFQSAVKKDNSQSGMLPQTPSLGWKVEFRVFPGSASLRTDLTRAVNWNFPPFPVPSHAERSRGRGKRNGFDPHSPLVIASCRAGSW